MKSFLSILICCWLGVQVPLLAQNNPIFSGGTKHGHSQQAFSQDQNHGIFIGGQEEGSHSTRYSQEDNHLIFEGGTEDGSSKGYVSLLQNGAIFEGGLDEGAHYQRHSQADNHLIFRGGTHDGAAHGYFSLSQTHDIFAGGTDDGSDHFRIDGLPSVYNPGFAVELLSFEAWPDGEQVLLQWTTASEVNHDYFLVERSQDLNEIDKLGRVEGKGGPQHVQPYDMTDVTPYPGRSYYRLQSFDLNGNSEASSWVEVMFEAKKDLAVSLYPNPTADLIHVRLTGAIAGDLEFRVFDLMGRHVGISKSVQAEDSLLESDLNLSNLSVGIYVLQITHRQKGIIGAYRLKVQR
ncbi:MAG: T9SS type A sorting domain-containing protein [Bacteroidota bacterium]